MSQAIPDLYMKVMIYLWVCEDESSGYSVDAFAPCSLWTWWDSYANGRAVDEPNGKDADIDRVEVHRCRRSNPSIPGRVILKLRCPAHSADTECRSA